MKIKSKLQLIIVAIVFLMAGIASLSFMWQKQAEKLSEREHLIMELNRVLFERARLREEYFLYREERSKVQSLLIHKEVEKLLERMSGTFTRKEEIVYLDTIRGFHTEIGELFNQLVRIEEGATVHTAATQDLRQRIISQMLVIAQSLHLEGIQLLKAAHETVAYQNELAQRISIIIFGLLGLLVISFALIIIRSITRPLIKLHEGAEIIATGNLDYKTNISTSDEIGQLSRAFDSMTDHLKKITVSRDDLFKEIEERKQAEEALRKETVIAQTFMDALPCVALLLKPRTREIVALNKTAREAGARLGATCFGSWPKLDKACSFCRAPEAWETGKPQTLEVDAIGNRWEAHWVPVSEDLYLHYALDITERKRAEEERRSLGERLNRAEKMEAIGILTGGVAHDLNNVLGIVVGYAEVLLMSADKSSSIRPTLVNIMNGGQRAAAIVQDLLTLTRRGVPGRDVLNLNRIVADCQRLPEFANLSFTIPL